MVRLLAAFAGALGALALSMDGASAQRITGAPFIDHFGVIDGSRWRISDGWSNGEWSANDWRASQVFRNDRGLSLVLARQRGGPKPFSSGEIQTHSLHRYGYFEARLRAPRGSGLVTGFFTYTRPRGARSWDEIDVEILGRDTRSILFTYYNNGQRRAFEHRLGFDASADWHTYAFEWTPQRIRWYVDGALVEETRGEGVAIPQAPQRLYLHLWNSETLTSWVGPIPDSGRQWTLQVSCVAHAERYEGRPLCGG